MTKKEAQLSMLMFASEELGSYVRDLLLDDILTEGEAERFDSILIKIDKVAEGIAEEIDHEATPPTYVYAVWDDCYGNIGYHKTFDGARKQLMEHGAYQSLADNYPLDYDNDVCWGWDVLHIERIKVEE